MRGKEAISWLWDWLGQGNMGRNYEVVEVVQPVVMIDGIRWPLDYECWRNAAQNVINGAVVTPLPPPESKFARLWIAVWVKSTAATAPVDSIERVINGDSFMISQQEQVTTALGDFPLIGGSMGRSATAGAQQGLNPQISYSSNGRSTLQHRHVDTVAAGTFVVRGCFIDFPESARLDSRFF